MGHCEERNEKLLELACGALDGADRVELEAHMAGCAGCRARLEEERAFVSLLRSAEMPEPRAEFLSGLADRAARAAKAEEAAEANVATFRRRKPPAYHLRLQIASIAAALMILALGLLVMRADKPFKNDENSIARVMKDYPRAAAEIEATSDVDGYDELAELMLGDSAAVPDASLTRDSVSGERVELSEYLNNIDEEEAEELLKMLEQENNS